MDPALWNVVEAGRAADVVAVLLRLRGGAEAPAGVRIVARFGDIATARVTRGAILDLRAHPDVISVKAARELRPEPALVERAERARSRARDRRNPFAPAMGPIGKGVVIGIVDWGIDVTHPNLLDASGRTRVEAIWDQRGGLGSGVAPYGYGRVLTRSDIDVALAAADPFAALGYDPLDADVDGNGTHGTHVADIAAGRPRVGRGGVAPGATIAFVHLATEVTGPRSIANSVSLLEAIDFLSRHAGDRPCVINMSLGSHAGPHDGTTLVEQALDAFVTGQTGRAIVQSAGNYRRAPVHASGSLAAGESHTLVWQVSARDDTTNELDIWYPGADRIAVELRDDSGEVVVRALPDQHGAIVADGQEVGRYAHRTHDPNNHDNHAALVIEPRGQREDWTVVLEPLAIVSEHARWHAWIERDEGGPRTQSRLHAPELSAATTLGTIANGHDTIVVGAYDRATGELGSFSSEGPTRDGRFKPDILAPGIAEVAARSVPADGGDELLTVKNGTSMAAPHVTGAVALLYEVGGSLSIHEVRAALGIAAGAAEPPKLDVRRAVDRVRPTPQPEQMRVRDEPRRGRTGMEIDDLLDMAVLRGTGSIRSLVDRLSPQAKGELRDLLTLARLGESGYVDPLMAPPPAPRPSRRPRPRLFTEDVYGTTYSDRPGAVARGRILQQTYMTIEIVQNTAGEWEVHYSEPVPTTATPFDDKARFASKNDAIPRARKLRAYGYTVVVREDGAGKGYCKVKSLTGSVGLPTKVGPDKGFEYAYSDSADVRGHALEAMGFGRTIVQLPSGNYQVQITSLPTFGTAKVLYTVVAKDTLFSIAKKYGVTVADLQTANNLGTSTSINPGDVLVIPPTAMPTTTPPATPPTTTPPAKTTPATTAPSKTTPTTTGPTSPTLASSSVGHDPGGDWSSGVVREVSFLRTSGSLSASKKTDGSAHLVFLPGDTVTLKSTSTGWVEVSGPAYARESGNPDVPVGTKTGWINRDWTSMSLGVFKDLPVDDRTDTYGKLSTGAHFAAGLPSKLIVHQTESPTGSAALASYAARIAATPPSTIGAHYLIDENGVVILVVPIDKVVSHIGGHNSEAVGIEHVGMPTSMTVPSSRTDTATLAALRTKVGGLTMSPKLKARILAMSDKDLYQFAKDSKDPKRTDWYLYGDINAVQKRASWLLVEKLLVDRGLAASDVYAHEALVAKSPGEGENIKEYLTAREAYPGLVHTLETTVAGDATLKADPTLTKIVDADKDTVAALKLDATAAENTAVLSGTDPAATKRQGIRDSFYARFWARYTQLDDMVTFLKASGSTKPTTLATKMKAWVF